MAIKVPSSLNQYRVKVEYHEAMDFLDPTLPRVIWKFEKVYYTAHNIHTEYFSIISKKKLSLHQI